MSSYLTVTSPFLLMCLSFLSLSFAAHIFDCVPALCAVVFINLILRKSFWFNFFSWCNNARLVWIKLGVIILLWNITRSIYLILYHRTLFLLDFAACYRSPPLLLHHLFFACSRRRRYYAFVSSQTTSNKNEWNFPFFLSVFICIKKNGINVQAEVFTMLLLSKWWKKADEDARLY